MICERRVPPVRPCCRLPDPIRALPRSWSSTRVTCAVTFLRSGLRREPAKSRRLRTRLDDTNACVAQCALQLRRRSADGGSARVPEYPRPA